MRLNFLLVLALLAAQVIKSAKQRDFPAFNFPMSGPAQQINMKNTANSNTNALAINSSGFGSANAFATGSAVNYNQVYQSQ